MDIQDGTCDLKEWEDKGYQLPKFDLQAVRQKTHDQPTWIHFGAGNIFRAFPAAILQTVLDSGGYDRGIIVAEGFDYEIIDKAHRDCGRTTTERCLEILEFILTNIYICQKT